MTRPTFRKTPAFIVTAAAWLVLVAFGLAACGKSEQADKAAEDTAATRAMMEKEQKEFNAGVARGGAAPIRNIEAEAKAAKAASKSTSKAQ